MTMSYYPMWASKLPTEDPTQSLAILGLIAAFFFIYGKKYGYFSLPDEGRLFDIPLSHVLFLFSSYLGANFILAPVFMKVFYFIPLIFFWAQLLVVVSIASLILYYMKAVGKIQMGYMWKSSHHSFCKDISMGLLTWFIAIPAVFFTEILLEALCSYFFSYREAPDQSVITYLRLTKHYPFFFGVAIITITLYAPFIEEFLFRGILQTFLINRIGTRSGILVTSFLFALFHFSSSQGLGNITIVGSLFIFSLFLGFLYERQKSLLSPIILHATFNVVSLIQLLFFTEGVFHA